MREVYGTIRKLGATSKYKGYYFVAEAIRMTMEFQERPMKITKDIYPKLAKKLAADAKRTEFRFKLKAGRTPISVPTECPAQETEPLPFTTATT